jgi:mRNA interferase MazF
MREGDVALVSLPQSDGRRKPRPCILLRRMPPFGDWLICGVSTQLHQQVAGFDDIMEVTHADFPNSGIRAASLIRLGFLTVIPRAEFIGIIGRVSKERHKRLLRRLAKFILDTESV